MNLIFNEFELFQKSSSSGRHLSVSVSQTTQKNFVSVQNSLLKIKNISFQPIPIQSKKKMDTMHGFLVPTYTLHDFDDGEECKVVRMIFQMSGVPYEFKHVHRDDYILEGSSFPVISSLKL